MAGGGGHACAGWRAGWPAQVGEGLGGADGVERAGQLGVGWGAPEMRAPHNAAPAGRHAQAAARQTRAPRVLALPCPQLSRPTSSDRRSARPRRASSAAPSPALATVRVSPATSATIAVAPLSSHPC